MCRHTELALQPTPTAAGDARRFVADACERWGLGALSADLTLPVSELVTNTVLHSRTPMTVKISVSCGAVEVSVHDEDPRTPVLRPVRTDLLGDIESLAAKADATDDADPRHRSLHIGAAGSIAAGRGMLIVDAVADEWGVANTGTGKDVWFAIAVPRDWPHRGQCPCERKATKRTASGRPVSTVPGPWDAVR